MTFDLPVRVRDHLEWTTVATSDDRDWYFGVDQKITPRFRSAIQGPQVYRFVILPPSSESPGFGGNRRIYVGESERFERRCADYKGALTRTRKSPQTFGWGDPRLGAEWKEMQGNPCVRVAGCLQDAERDSSKVELQLLKFDEFWIDRVQVTPKRIGNQCVRRLVENLAILSSDSPKVILLNQCRNTETRPYHTLENPISYAGERLADE